MIRPCRGTDQFASVKPQCPNRFSALSPSFDCIPAYAHTPHAVPSCERDIQNSNSPLNLCDCQRSSQTGLRRTLNPSLLRNQATTNHQSFPRNMSGNDCISSQWDPSGKPTVIAINSNASKTNSPFLLGHW